jgi:hypothetical protein
MTPRADLAASAMLLEAATQRRAVQRACMRARGRVVVPPPPPAAPRPRAVSRGRRETHVDAAEAERSFGWPSTLRDGDGDAPMSDRPQVRQLRLAHAIALVLTEAL